MELARRHDRISARCNPARTSPRDACRAALVLLAALGLRTNAETGGGFLFEFDRFDGLHASYKDGWKVDNASGGSEGLNIATRKPGAMLTKTAKVPRAGRYYIYLVARDRGTVETLGIDNQIFRCDLRQLKPGSDQWAKFPVNLSPTELEARNYEITLLHVESPPGVVALVDHLLFESVDKPTGPSVQELPDLAPVKGSLTGKDSHGVEAETITEGQAITLTAQVHNCGKAAAPAAQLQFVEFAGGEIKVLGAPLTVPSLVPGAKHEGKCSTVLPPGTHRVGVQLDPTEQVAEEDEKNNLSEPCKLVVVAVPQWQRRLNQARTRWEDAGVRTQRTCLGSLAVAPLLLLVARLLRRLKRRKPVPIRYLGLVCEQCGAELEPGAKACTMCGHRLTEATPRAVPIPVGTADDGCPRCGSSLEAGDRVCTNCGQQLAAAPQPETVAPPSPFACPACGEVSEAAALFCQACGAAMERAASAEALTQPHESAPSASRACPACGNARDSSRPFCTRCGAKAP